MKAPQMDYYFDCSIDPSAEPLFQVQKKYLKLGLPNDIIKDRLIAASPEGLNIEVAKQRLGVANSNTFVYDDFKDFCLKFAAMIKNKKITKQKLRCLANPAYQGRTYALFAHHQTEACHAGDMFNPAAPYALTKSDDVKLRTAFLNAGLYKIIVFPMWTFKDVQKITVLLFWDNDYKGPVQIYRAGEVCKMTLTKGPWMLPYGEVGLEMFTRPQTRKFIGKLKMEQGRGKKPNVEWCVAFGEKVAFNQVGWGNRYDRKIAGIVTVLGRKDQPSKAMKRFLYYDGMTKKEAEFLASYMRDVDFGILGSMVVFEKNATKEMFMKIPLVFENSVYSRKRVHELLNFNDAHKALLKKLLSQA